MSKVIEKIKNGKFLAFVKQVAPDALDLVGDITGISALNKLSEVVQGKKELTEEEKKQALEFYKLDLEETDMHLKDVQSARVREVDMAKTGKTDWLMYASGITALSTFILMVIAVIFIPSAKENPLFHQLMGIIEGVAMTIFAYYFGTSKSSSDKNKLLTGR